MLALSKDYLLLFGRLLSRYLLVPIGTMVNLYRVSDEQINSLVDELGWKGFWVDFTAGLDTLVQERGATCLAVNVKKLAC